MRDLGLIVEVRDLGLIVEVSGLHERLGTHSRDEWLT